MSRNVFVPHVWEYEPTRPYRVGNAVYGDLLACAAELEDAVRFFVTNFVPPVGVETMAYVVDSRGAMVLGWWNRAGHPTLWVGVAEAYRTFARIHDPLEVAWFELAASGALARMEIEG